MTSARKKISFIIPCYFNGANIPGTMSEVVKIKLLINEEVDFEYILVDDGSKDNTLEELIKFKNQYPEQTTVIKLSGNFGAYNAAQAGLNYATGDCNVILAADMQDPPELIPKMFDYWKGGIKLVIANRTDRQDPWLQKLFSNTYHFLIKKLALPNVPDGGFDLVLFDRQLRDNLVMINEKNTNISYLLTWLKYDMVCIPYVRQKRDKGISRWTLQKKMKLFIDSFVSFSFFPVRIITVLGFILGFFALGYTILILIAKYNDNVPVEGWSSLMVVLLLVSCFQMISMGILGEYVWRAMDAARNRPSYIVDKVI